MKKIPYYLNLPLCTIGLGLLGFYQRRRQLASALDPETHLFIPFAPVTVALTLIVVLAAAMGFFSLLRIKDKAPQDYSSAFRASGSSFVMTLMTAAGFLFFAAFVLCARDAYTQYLLWKHSMFTYKPAIFPVVAFLTAILMLPAGGGALLLGKGNYRPPLGLHFPVLTTLPAFASLAWLVLTYQVCSRDPMLAYYVWNLLGVVCTVLALYFFCAFAYRRPRPRYAVFFAGMGIALNLISLAELPSLTWTVVTAAFTLLLLAGEISLLRNWTGPPWPRRIAKGGEQMPLGGGSEQTPTPAEERATDNTEGESSHES